MTPPKQETTDKGRNFTVLLWWSYQTKGINKFTCVNLAALSSNLAAGFFSLAALVSTGSRTVTAGYRAAPHLGVTCHPSTPCAARLKALNPSTASPGPPPRHPGLRRETYGNQANGGSAGSRKKPPPLTSPARGSQFPAAERRQRDASCSAVQSLILIVGRRTVRHKIFCKLQSPRDDEEVRDSNRHRVKNRRRILTGPLNHEN